MAGILPQLLTFVYPGFDLRRSLHLAFSACGRASVWFMAVAAADSFAAFCCRAAASSSELNVASET